MRRLLYGSAAALVVAATVALPGTAALAAATGPSVSAYFPGISVAAGAAKVNLVYGTVTGPGADDAVTVGELTVTLDTSGLAGLATVASSDELDQTCSRSGALLTCTVDGPLLLTGDTDLVPLLALEVTGAKDATEGDSGKLTFTTKADDGPAVTSTSTVTVGEGVDLAGFIDAKATKVAAGATVDTDLKVANAGTTTVHGVDLVMLGYDPSLLAGEGFSNCTYGLLTVCTFDDELSAGTTYGLSSPLRLKIPADAAAGSEASAIGSWYTPSDLKELLATLPGDEAGEVLGNPGTGAAVHLQEVVKSAAKLRKLDQVDTDPDNNVLLSEIEVTGGQQPDEAAVGATVTGAAGDKIAAKVGFVNKGPGTLYHWTFDNTDIETDVTLPPGLKVVTADERCEAGPSPVEDNGDGAPVDDSPDYTCFTDSGSTKANASTLFDFTFKVEFASVAGRVVINDDEFGDSGTLDRSKSDNSAPLKLALAGGGNGAGAGAGAGGGELPRTGSNAALIGGAGVLLAAAGVFGLVVFRRRRVRFTA